MFEVRWFDNENQNDLYNLYNFYNPYNPRIIHIQERRYCLPGRRQLQPCERACTGRVHIPLSPLPSTFRTTGQIRNARARHRQGDHSVRQVPSSMVGDHGRRRSCRSRPVRVAADDPVLRKSRRGALRTEPARRCCEYRASAGCGRDVFPPSPG